jgi:metal-responsive CopG/Arc/MetJ family transcriptional regulator
MPSKNPRINVVMEKPLHDTVELLAKKGGVSMSFMVRDLVREALELHEDVSLAAFAEGRDKTFKTSKALKHDEVW